MLLLYHICEIRLLKCYIYSNFKKLIWMFQAFIQNYNWKQDWKSSLFPLLFSECFYLYMNPHSRKVPLLMCCIKVISAFLLFCRRCHFVFKFLLSFIVSFIKIKLLRLQTWTKSLFVCFYLKIPNQPKTQFCPNFRYDLVAFMLRNLLTLFASSFFTLALWIESSLYKTRTVI